MFLDGPVEIREWLQGHFPILDWEVTQHISSKHLVVDGWFVWREYGVTTGMTNVLSFICGPNAHTEFLDMAIERILDQPHVEWHNLPANWKGEYVEYRSPERIL